jgi:hypothetical protein
VTSRTRRNIVSVAVLLALMLVSAPGSGQEETVTTAQITSFKDAGLGGRVDGVIWRGGFVMASASDVFGGLSSITFTGPEGRLAMVSDKGRFVSGQLLYDEAGVPFGLVGVRIEAMQNSRGADLPRQFARDAEALDTVYRNGAPVAVRVGFENLTRVADFDLIDSVPGGPAREISVPAWVSAARDNDALESLCIAPNSSPVAGSTLLIMESVMTAEGNHRATLLGQQDKGDLSLTPISGLTPTDCAFLPNGDLLVLERGIAFLTFTMRLRLIPAAEVHPGAVMEGRVILNASGSDIDNMEGLAVHPGPDGKPRITLISDNNFNDWERSLLLEFSLPE